MKRGFCVGILVALCAEVLTMGVAGAQPQGNIGHLPQVQTPGAMALPAPVVVPSKGVQGATMPATGNAEEARRAGNARMTMALLQIEAGTLTPEQAWQSGALTYDNIADFFEKRADEWIINARRNDDGLHHVLISLLLAHKSDKFKALSKVSQPLRLWLADYYQSNNDPKCIEVAQSILKQMPCPLPHVDDTSADMLLVYQAIERMAWFYRDQDQYEKGAQMWLSMLQWFKQPGWYQTFAQEQGARYYRDAGQIDKAKEIYAHLTICSPWTVGLGLHDRTMFLIGEGDYQEAQKVVEQAKASRNDALPHYVPTYLEAKLAMKKGMWIQAHSLYSQAANEYAEISPNNDDPKGRMLDGINQGTQWSQKWMEKSYDFSIPDTTTVVERSDDGTASTSWTVRVDCARSTQFKVECANSKVKITINDETETFYGYQTTFDISVTLGKSDDFVDSNIRIYPVDHPEKVETVPLFIEVK